MFKKRDFCLKLSLIIGCATLMACNEDIDRQDDYEQSAKAIINGLPDTSQERQAVVALYVKDADGWDCRRDGQMCTGTLIHPSYVLSAAHCVTDSGGGVDACVPYLKIGIGDNEAAIASNLYDIEEVTAKSTYNKAFYLDDDYGTVVDDIALIKLKTPVPSSVAKPILNLPPWLGMDSKTLGDKGIDIDFSGYGYNEEGKSGERLHFTTKARRYCGPKNRLDPYTGCKHGSVRVTGCHPDPDTCEYYGEVDETDYILIPYRGIYYEQIDGGPCQGDSGGPGFVTIGGVTYLAAITSYGDAICKYYGISAATQDYYAWLTDLAPELADVYVEICDNGIDDNGNGLIDCDDPQCQDAIHCQPEICDNGIDDNGNDLIDCDDPQCQDAIHCQPEICDNGIDDNGNDLIDCDDPQCQDAIYCQPEICDNGIDDNGNDLIDCDDPQCQDAIHCQPEICDNGIDDNANGLIDCDDPQCQDAIHCQPEICDNGIDDNANGLIDCDDPQCQDAIYCQPEICDNGIDDNANGLIDCDDPQCQDAAFCKTFDEKDSSCSASTRRKSSAPISLLLFGLLSLSFLRKRKAAQNIRTIS